MRSNGCKTIGPLLPSAVFIYVPHSAYMLDQVLYSANVLHSFIAFLKTEIGLICQFIRSIRLIETLKNRP